MASRQQKGKQGKPKLIVSRLTSAAATLSRQLLLLHSITKKKTRGLKTDLLSILSRKFLCLSLYSGSNFFQFLLSTMSSDAPQNYGSLSRRLIFHPSILSWACFDFVLVFFKLSIISVLPSCRQSLAADPLPPSMPWSVHVEKNVFTKSGLGWSIDSVINVFLVRVRCH